MNEKPPTAEEILTIWERFVLENKSIIERELSLLSVNQRKLLIFLAGREKTNEIFSKENSQKSNLMASSMQRAVESLVEKDYVCIDGDKCYKILDPLIKSVLS